MTCPLCATPLASAEVVNRIARNDQPQVSVICPTCALVQEYPPPSAEKLAAYYATQYREEFDDLEIDGHEPWTPAWVEAQRASSLQYVREVVLPNLGADASPKRVLEIGAGHGFVAEAFVAGGAEVDVVEPGAQSRERLLSLPGVTLLDATTPHEVTSGDYDLVIALHVLEHDRDPVSFARRCLELARPGGHVWLEVPDVMRPYGALSHFFQTPHVYNFSVHSLAVTLLRAGANLDATRVGPAAFAKVLLGWTRRSEEPVAERDYAAVTKHLTKKLQGGVAADVAAHLVAYEWRRTKSDGALLARWLSGESAQEIGGDRFETFLRTQFRDLDASGQQMRQDLHAWTKQVETWVSEVSTAWHETEWRQGYVAGAAVMAQACQVRVTHLLNQDILRGMGGGNDAG